MRAALEIPQHTLTAFLETRPPDRIIARQDDTSMTFGQLLDASRRIAGGLRELGIGKGDRVALWLPNCLEWLVLFFACARLGAIALSVNTRFRSAEVADIVGRSGARILVLWPNFKGIDFPGILADVETDALADLEAVVTVGGGDGDGILEGRPTRSYEALRKSAPYRGRENDGRSLCALFTTSGTTSKPKFVAHRQSTVLHHANDVARHFGYHAPDTRLLQATPFCGVFGFAQMMAGLVAERPSVLMTAFNAAEGCDLLTRHDITHSNGGDEMLHRLLEVATGERPFPALRQFGFARFNAALEDIAEQADARGVPAVGLYGMSEVFALFSRWQETMPVAARRLGGGIPVSPYAMVRARDPESGAALPHGTSGELQIRAPSMMAGYYGNAAATEAATTADDWFRTGDFGHSLERGGFVYEARMGDTLRLGGFLVNPQEIEAFLIGLPGVSDAQVVSVDRQAGAKPVAFVIQDPDAPPLGETDILAHCKAGLAGFKVPLRVYPLETFPTTASANGTKIQRAKLRAMATDWTAETDGGSIPAAAGAIGC